MKRSEKLRKEIKNDWPWATEEELRAIYKVRTGTAVYRPLFKEKTNG